MKKFMERIGCYRNFVQIHKSHIVNIMHLKTIDIKRNIVKLSNDIELTVARRCVKAIKNLHKSAGFLKSGRFD